jgi:hypothetical protein
MRCFFESPRHVSVGSIESIRTNKKNKVKYEIAYPDKKGKVHKAWSNWMQNDGYNAGDSIPVQSLSIPCTFGLCSTLLEVKGMHQQHSELYVAAIVATGVGLGLLGYCLGKKNNKN